jgi:hypothetical protein
MVISVAMLQSKDLNEELLKYREILKIRIMFVGVERMLRVRTVERKVDIIMGVYQVVMNAQVVLV